MRGSPLLRALLAFLAILSLGFPLWRLTSTEIGATPAPLSPEGSMDARKVRLQITITTPPASLRVMHLGKEIWSELAPVAEAERDLELPVPSEGVDLRFEITWPPDAPLAAVRVRFTDPAGGEHEQTIWGRGSADEVLTFP